jgi:hypothetical protein
MATAMYGARGSLTEGRRCRERRLVIYTSNKVFCQGGDERVEGELRAVNHEMTSESLRDCDWPVG